ncbi:MAG: YtxH domain-containing protein [Cyanosarcina radialis HA8281-LM2]|jgi:gas vesicle protein|nr:YtxH domain-containing protein [Cyanosarcina radialis HA8281-LM2]
MSKKGDSSFIGGLLLGAAMGTIAGLLAAPRAGRETRQLLKKSAEALPELAEDLSSSVQIQAERLSASAIQKWEQTLNRLQDAIAAGMEATQQERQVLKNGKAQTPSESRPGVSDYRN